jgi:hypothetical protein
MENFLSALAFAGLIAAQFLSVVLVQTQRCDDQFLGTWNRKASIPARWPSAESVRTSAHQFSPIDCSDATTTAVDRLTRLQHRDQQVRYVGTSQACTGRGRSS